MKTKVWTATLLVVWGCSQSPKDESRRGAKQSALPSVAQEGDADANAKPGGGESRQVSEVIKDSPVVISDRQLLLSLRAEADLSGLDPAFTSDLLSIQQVAPGRTLFYTKNSLSYVADDAQRGLLNRLSTPFIFSKETTVYVQEEQRFWLLDGTSLAFPASQPSNQIGQVTLLTIVPELLKDPAVKPRLLFVGPRQLILTSGSRANVVVREGDKARVLSFDFPEASNSPLEVLHAGVGTSDRLYWFATAERLLVLKKSEQGEWSWVISPFKIELPPTDASSGQLSMILELQGEKDVIFVGTPLVLAGGKVYASEALKFTLPDPNAAAVTAAFTANVKPLLTNFCVPCHADYDTEANARLKSEAYKTHLMNKTMPPNAPLSDVDTKVILDWYATIPL